MGSPFKQKSKDIVDTIKQAPMLPPVPGGGFKEHGNIPRPILPLVRAVKKGRELYEKIDTPKERKDIRKKIGKKIKDVGQKTVKKFKDQWETTKHSMRTGFTS